MNEHPEKFSKERRKAPRVSGALVEYSIDGKDVSKNKAFIKDICIYGICIYISEEIGKDAVINLDIFLFGDNEPINAQGKVVWQKKGSLFRLL